MRLSALPLLSSLIPSIDAVTLAWDRGASHTNLSAYIVKYGVTSGSYTGQVSVAASQTTATVNNLVPGRTYYFVVTAKNTANLESDPSNQITYTVPASSPNASPTLNPINGLALNRNSGVQTVNLTGISSGAAHELQRLTVTASSSNPGLIATPTVSYSSPNSSGTLQFTATSNSSGTANITVTVRDDAASNNVMTRTFTVSVSSSSWTPALRVRWTPARQAVVTVTGQPSRSHEIYATQDFKSWTLLNTVTLSTSGSAEFVDANATRYPRRFYRVRAVQ